MAWIYHFYLPFYQLMGIWVIPTLGPLVSVSQLDPDRYKVLLLMQLDTVDISFLN